MSNGNKNQRKHRSKESPGSCSSRLEEGCNGYGGPMRFSSPGSGLSGMSGSVLSATSESAISTQSGYSTGGDSLLSSSCEGLIILGGFQVVEDLD